MIPENPYLLIGLSVLMHVTWNLLARHVESRANYLWWGLAAHILILGPYAVWQLLVSAQWTQTLLLALAVTAAANTFYFIALRRAYHYAPVALVYPLARSSPVLIAAWAWLFFSVDLSLAAFGAIVVSVLGLWVLGASSSGGDSRHALPWAALAALATSIYSLSDKLAVTYLPNFASQLGFVTIGYSVAFIGISVVQYRESGRWVPAVRPPWRYILLGGVCIGTAYALVVRAMREMPAAHVVTFTNAGIVLAVVLSVVLFRERAFWRQRFVGAAIVCVGLLLLGMVETKQPGTDHGFLSQLSP